MGKNNFGYLLAGLLILLIFDPILSDRLQLLGYVISEVSYLVVLILGVWSLMNERRWFVFGSILALLAIFLTAANLYLRSMTLFVIDLGVILVFYVLSTGVALRYIFMDRELSVNKLMGSLCVYLLIGVAWSILHAFVYLLTPDAFSNLQGQSGEFLYYSFVTLTTLGYGDIAPLTPMARTLAYLEAIAGQFYLAVLVAGLVGAYVSRSSSEGAQTQLTPGASVFSPVRE